MNPVMYSDLDSDSLYIARPVRSPTVSLAQGNGGPADNILPEAPPEAEEQRLTSLDYSARSSSSRANAVNISLSIRQKVQFRAAN